MVQEMEDSTERPVVGGWQFKGYDENGLCRYLNGRFTGALQGMKDCVQRTSRCPFGI